MTAAQVVWLLILYSGWILNTGILARYLDFIGSSEKVSSNSYELPYFVSRPIELVTVCLIVGITLYFLGRAPKTAAHVTIRTTDHVTKVVEPVVRRTVTTKNYTAKPWVTTIITRLLTSLILLLATIPAIYMVEGIGAEVLWAITICLGIIAFTMSLFAILERRMSRTA